jgi:hypothetical protein
MIKNHKKTRKHPIKRDTSCDILLLLRNRYRLFKKHDTKSVEDQKLHTILKQI